MNPRPLLRLLAPSFPLLVLACAACSGARAVSPPPPTETEWTAARAWLADLRATEPLKPYGAVVRVSLREPHTGRTFSARGAVAVDPHRAMRMILLGPAGATALDVWVTPDRWRFEVPAANLLRRGGSGDDASLPIGFFRWWFLAPMNGRLLTSDAAGRAERLVLRDGAATVDLTDVRDPFGHAILASRRSHGALDSLAFRGESLAAQPGDHAAYDQASSGVHVDVTVESLSDAPDPAAFVDPEGAEGAEGAERRKASTP
jgi:hypothetical protein